MKEGLKSYGVNALIVTNPINVRYLSGFTGSSGFLIITSRKQVLVTDSRYIDREMKRTKSQNHSFDILNIADKNWMNLLKSKDIIGIEGDNITLDKLQYFKKNLKGCKFKKIKSACEESRMIKTDSEIRCMKKASQIAEKALVIGLDNLKIGISEESFSWFLEKTARENGADGLSFSPIVAFGENSSFPHHESGARKLKKGDIVLIDFGVKYKGYCSDMTRTFMVDGDNSLKEDFMLSYDLVLESQQSALSRIKPGVTVKSLYNTANNVFKDLELDDYFTHSLGHGIGLEAHESPRVSEKDKTVLRPGMFITIEPGLYFNGQYGIRIEDTVLVTENGYKNMNKFSKDLTIIKGK